MVKKKHADFQDDYRRSSNFNNPIKKEEFKIKKNGNLKMPKEKKAGDLEASENERINDAMEAFEERPENAKKSGKKNPPKK